MTGSSTSPKTSVEHDTVPAQRSSAERSAAERADAWMRAVRTATERLYGEVTRLDDIEITRPSRLPGWTRAHVVTHLARQADALVNLLTWARTGIEHPMYASRADRDADIKEGALRLAQVIREDLLAASTRFEAAADRMTGADWRAQVAHRTGRVFPAVEVPWLRLFEVWVHLVDLDVGVGFADVPDAHLEWVLEGAVYPHVERAEGTPVRIRAELPGGGQRSWEIRVPAAATSSGEISGPARDMAAWLAGRGSGTGLTGALPTLPAWG
jgi:maleylpyruvate isomerase